MNFFKERNHYTSQSKHKICLGECEERYTMMLKNNNHNWLKTGRDLDQKMKKSRFRQHIIDDGKIHCGTCEFLNSSIHHQLMKKSMGKCLEQGEKYPRIAGLSLLPCCS